MLSAADDALVASIAEVYNQDRAAFNKNVRREIAVTFPNFRVDADTRGLLVQQAQEWVKKVRHNVLS